MKYFVIFILLISVFVTSCDTDAAIVSYNLSKEADMFNVHRRVVFYNGITGDYIFVIEGRCSLAVDIADNQLELTCKTGPDSYKKHFLGLSDNVTYFAEQIEPLGIDNFHYKVIFKPKAIIPDIDLVN